jgi:hypothetical protein
MILDPEFDALILSPSELEILGDRFASKRNELALLAVRDSENEDSELIQAEFENLEGVIQERFTSALEILGDPQCVADFHYSIAEHSITRSYLAWSKTEDEPLAILTRRADGFALTTRSMQEIEALITQVLAIDDGLASANLAMSLSAVTTLVSLGLMDAFRFSHLQSWLTHTAPPQSYSAGDVLERVRGATSEDFRWPLLFFEKILPNGTIASIKEEEVVQALGVLEDAGVVLSLSDDEASSNPRLFAFSDAGELIADGLLHTASKVALRISRIVGEGEVGHEALLFVRDPNYLWLFDIAGQEGVVASLDCQSWDELSGQLFYPQQDLLEEVHVEAGQAEGEDIQEKDDIHGVATVMQSDLNVQVERCPKCATMVKAGNRFCSTCGATLE